MIRHTRLWDGWRGRALMWPVMQVFAAGLLVKVAERTHMGAGGWLIAAAFLATWLAFTTWLLWPFER